MNCYRYTTMQCYASSPTMTGQLWRLSIWQQALSTQEARNSYRPILIICMNTVTIHWIRGRRTRTNSYLIIQRTYFTRCQSHWIRNGYLNSILFRLFAFQRTMYPQHTIAYKKQEESYILRINRGLKYSEGVFCFSLPDIYEFSLIADNKVIKERLVKKFQLRLMKHVYTRTKCSFIFWVFPIYVIPSTIK